MEEDIYRKLAQVLDTLPNGFPPAENGVEIKLLKKIFAPEEADLFCDLRLNRETAEQIAQRTGRPLEGLEQRLLTMRNHGQISGLKFGGTWVFKMVPYLFGIHEFQLHRLDKEMAQLMEEYLPSYAQQFFKVTPQLMQVLPVEADLPVEQVALPYEQVSVLIEKSKSFLVNECHCRKEQALLDKPCPRTLEVCLAVAPVPHAFDDFPMGGRVISKEEAYAVLKKGEEESCVHLTQNMQNGQVFICNCCSCCCGILRSITELGLPAWDVVNSHYYARIDPDKCISCGLCAGERCQVGAIEEGEEAYQIIPEKCIGCGLCISTCPEGAIKLVHKDQDVIFTPPLTEMAWFEDRANKRGVDFSAYK
jgi:Na+-translocating ferredoxin:NAD+ oxidoreductase subunit B